MTNNTEKTEDPKPKTTGKVKVTGLPRTTTWPACNAQKKFGIAINDFRKLKLGETIELPRSIAERLIELDLVILEGGK